MFVAVIIFCTKYTNEPHGINDHIEYLRGVRLQLHGKVNGPPGIVKRGPIYNIYNKYLYFLHCVQLAMG